MGRESIGHLVDGLELSCVKGNVSAVEPATHLELVNPAVGIGTGPGKGLTMAKHHEDAATAGDQPIPLDTSSGVQDVLVIDRSDNSASLHRRCRIPLARHDDADGSSAAEPQAICSGHVSAGGGLHDLCQRGTADR